MKIGFDITWASKIYYSPNTNNINPTSSNISCNQKVHFLLFEKFQSLKPLGLCKVAMKFSSFHARETKYYF
uniref:ATP-dependent RNA helicase DRS1 n=1 Tax=Arundo donax TaxID=35708 RepID=A0A0A9CUN4_ARUDO